MRVLVALMTRVPVPGQTKTRLMTHLSGEACAVLHRAFLEDVIAMLTEVVAFPTAIFYTPPDNAQSLRELINGRLPMVPQEGETLGERMATAMRWGLAQGYEGVIVVGADLPTLPANIFYEAVQQLRFCDVVLGPTFDGGYYLIAAKGDYPAMFQDVAWGTGTVFEATMGRIHDMGLTTSVLPAWNDVDTFEDLQLLKAQLDELEMTNPTANSFTRNALKTILESELAGFTTISPYHK